jgi:hypothetical protein
MKLNDIRVLRNILGDKIEDDDHDEFLERKVPSMEIKKLNLGKMPKKDMYGRNLEAPHLSDEEKKKVAEKAYDYMQEKGTRTVNTDDPLQQELTRTTKELELEQKKKKLAELRDPRNKQIENIHQYAKYQEAQALSNMLTPRRQEPTSKPMGFNIPGTQKRFEVPIPTMHGLQKGYQSFSRNVATPLTENLGFTAGGALVGEFANEQASKKLQKAVSLKQQYMSYLSTKYNKKGYNVRNMADLRNVASDKEIKRLENLDTDIQRDQRTAGTMGFMSGTSGRAIMQRSRNQSQNTNIKGMTQIGGQRTNIGSFGSENLSRLGVTQNLTSVTPENKWGVLFDNNQTTSTDKLTKLIGKAPEPVPGSHRKLDKYIKVLDTDKVRKFL